MDAIKLNSSNVGTLNHGVQWLFLNTSRIGVLYMLGRSSGPKGEE